MFFIPFSSLKLIKTEKCFEFSHLLLKRGLNEIYVDLAQSDHGDGPTGRNQITFLYFSQTFTLMSLISAEAPSFDFCLMKFWPR